MTAATANLPAAPAPILAAPSAAEEMLIVRYLPELLQLSPAGRLEVIARLVGSLREPVGEGEAAVSAQKEEEPNALPSWVGAWADMPGTDDEIMDQIRGARVFSRPEISLD